MKDSVSSIVTPRLFTLCEIWTVTAPMSTAVAGPSVVVVSQCRWWLLPYCRDLNDSPLRSNQWRTAWMQSVNAGRVLLSLNATYSCVSSVYFRFGRPYLLFLVVGRCCNHYFEDTFPELATLEFWRYLLQYFRFRRPYYYFRLPVVVAITFFELDLSKPQVCHSKRTHLLFVFCVVCMWKIGKTIFGRHFVFSDFSDGLKNLTDASVSNNNGWIQNSMQNLSQAAR